MDSTQDKLALMFTIPNCLIKGSVAIVGSSGSLKGKQLGREIDSHDTVIRFNRAPTKTFEEDVGSKTTIRVVNGHVYNGVDISNNDGGYENQPPDFIKKCEDESILVVSPEHAFSNKSSAVSFINNTAKNIHPSSDGFVFNYACMNQLKKTMNANFPRNLSVGACAVALVKMTIDNSKKNIIPNIYGFDASPSIDRTHYWEKRPPKADNKSHNISGEMQMLLDLHQDGFIKFAY
jgi:hypothetical protein